ncbi:MAG: FtsX-like permease family protein [Clostridiales bacterium]|nr:FtsX-like permease family protein [Clostridiales bacterium]
MLRFVIRKMLNKKWMVLSLLIGNILLISIAAGNPIYTQAVLQRTLTKNLEAYLNTNNTYPALITVRTGGTVNDGEFLRQYQRNVSNAEDIFGLEVVENVEYFKLNTTKSVLLNPRGDVKEEMISLSSMSEIEDHIEIIAGRMYSDQPDENGYIEAIVTERGLKEMNALLDDVLVLPNQFTPDGNQTYVHIVGVFRNSSAEDHYWVYAPSTYDDDCFIHPELYNAYYMNGTTLPYPMSGTWYSLLDYTAMRGDEAENILASAEVFRGQFGTRATQAYRDTFSETLSNYLMTAQKVRVTLTVLQIPIFALLAAFIFMVSKQMLDMEQNEIAVIKSRGAGSSQIISIYLMQSFFIAVISFAIGIPFGMFLCQAIGSANAFLEFVQRSALPVELNTEALIYAISAAVLSILAMVVPVIGYSRTTIVAHKRRKNQKSTIPMWQKFGLDIIVLGISVYGLYTFNNQKELLAQRVLSGASLDPLLFISSSLFMLGAGLLAVRLIPYVVGAVFWLFRRIWSPALYASFLRVLRTRSSQGFIMVFLIMTIALGVFNAQAARTINQNKEDNLRYSIGADIAVQQIWEDNSAMMEYDPSLELVYNEPDFGLYENVDGAASIAKVFVDNGVSVGVSGSTLKRVKLMGIETDVFGQTAWFKNSLSDVHWYNYLNAISQNSQAVLVSSNFRTLYNCKLGDTITYRGSNGDTARGIIYGFVDYFPSYVPTSYTATADGILKEAQNFLIVAHLHQLQAEWGILPYELWINSEDGNAYFYDFAEENALSFSSFKDANAALIEAKNDPVLQGTNGILTVGFIVVLILCSVGFLIYWILSIQSRSLQFGIYRAMGMSMREIISMLLNEQVCISGMSIAVGALVGTLTAKLFMPLIQLAYTSNDNALPLEVISQQADNVRLFSVVGIVILLCMLVLGMLISRMKIAQALKLGED